MNENISYDTIAALLVDHFKFENECEIIINFLDHALNTMQPIFTTDLRNPLKIKDAENSLRRNL
jgi:hypothetical protein